MMLLDSPDMKRLLESLPANVDREQLQGVYLKRERQFQTLQDRAAAIRNRCDAIARALPDANSKAARALLDERRDLLAEQAALPMDLTVGAQLYADALSGWAVTTVAAVTQERRRVHGILEQTDDAYRDAAYALQQFSPGAIGPDYDHSYSTLRKLAEQRKPHIDESNDLMQLEELITQFVKDALGADPGVPHSVKVVEGRPMPGHVERFVATAAKAA